MSEKKIWTRQKGERTKSYHLFTIYRDLGPNRSQRRAHEKHVKMVQDEGDSKVKPVSLQQFERYSSDWNWVERAEAYDDYLEEKSRLNNELEIEKMNKRHAHDAEQIQNAAIKDLLNVEPYDESKASIEGRKNAAARTWKIGVDAERLARGVATEKVEQSGMVKQKIESKGEGKGLIADKITDPRDRAALTRLAEKYSTSEGESEP